MDTTQKTINRWIFTPAGKGKLILESRYTNNKDNLTAPLATKNRLS